MPPLADHPLRYMLANELHARPFPTLEAPCTAAYLAVQQDGPEDREVNRAHLIALIDRFGGQHPKPDATHYYGEIGRFGLKWEQHTEFVAYTVFADGVSEKPFDPSAFEVYPADWLEDLPGRRITSVLIRVDRMPEEAEARRCLRDWFVPESLAVSRVLDGAAVIASDFRIDSAGHMRMAVFAEPGTGGRRIGRIAQWLCEIETYKAMSMLGLAMVRGLSGKLGSLDDAMSDLMSRMTGGASAPDETLKALLSISAEIETILAQTSFRFGAAGAYEKLVDQRTTILREETVDGRQTFGEFMMRRFDPAMRTVKSTEKRLHEMSVRALRAGELLRTRVDVDRSAQNQRLLESMDRRADLQLRLQRTVEGLSVVAISYYAVSLAAYACAPLMEAAGVTKATGTAILVPIVVLGVWAMLRRVRRSVE